MCEPYDLDAVLRGLRRRRDRACRSRGPPTAAPPPCDASPTPSAPRCSSCPFGRARLEPWPHVPRDGGGDRHRRARDHQPPPRRAAGPARGRARCRGDPTPERGGLHVVLDVGGTEVDLVGVHLTSRLPYGPPIQLRRLRRQLPPAGRPTIVAGDCNFWGPGVTTFLPGWTPHRPRPHLARQPPAQPDRPHPRARPRHRGARRRGAARGRLRPPTGASDTCACGRQQSGVAQADGQRTSRRSRVVVALAKGAPVEVRDIVVPDPGPGEVRVDGAGVRRVPHRPALPRRRDQRRLPVPPRPRGRRTRSSRSAPTSPTSRPATS